MRGTQATRVRRERALVRRQEDLAFWQRLQDDALTVDDMSRPDGNLRKAWRTLDERAIKRKIDAALRDVEAARAKL